MTAHDARPVARWDRNRMESSDPLEQMDDGGFVLFTDYDALRAEVERLREWRRELCERLGFDCAAGAYWDAAYVAADQHKQITAVTNLANEQRTRAEAAEARVAEIMAAGRDYMTAKSLTSMPLKHQFARDRGLEIRGELGCEAVHEWMIAAHKRLDDLLNAKGNEGNG